MKNPPKVLVVDDQVGDLDWIVDYLRDRGYEIDVAANQDAAIKRLDAVRQGKEEYSLAIIDVMVAIKDLMELADLDDQFYEESRSTGVRLCRYARQELGLTSGELPIVCISAREDIELETELEELEVPLFRRVSQNSTESIREYLRRNLPRQNSNSRFR